MSFKLGERISDYIDCAVAATAAARHEDLLSEDSRIWRARRSLKDDFGVNVRRYKDLVA